MRKDQRVLYVLKKQIDAVTTASECPELAPIVAADMVAEGRTSETELLAVLGQIPPIALGNRTYRVAYAGSSGYHLLGSRGGSSHLVRNVKVPTMWWHTLGGGAWYRSDDGLTFARAS